jgi:hypothetical protein
MAAHPATLEQVPRLRLALPLVAGVLLVAAVVFAITRAGNGPAVPVVPTPKGATHGKAIADPYAWTPARSADFSRRAAAGTSHLLYTLSPGGAAVSAARTLRWRPQVERAAKAAGVDANRLEALVFLESAGRPDALTGAGTEGAAGLTQILAETARDLLGMKVDSARSRSYTRRIATAVGRLQLRHAAALSRARRRVDERFDPAQALAGTARYLALAKKTFGREDLAFVSYHMGIGNLKGVLTAFGGGPRPYAQLYFDSTPTRHPAAYARLASFGDDSSNYFWKLGAAEQIMALARHDPARLARLAALQTSAPSAARVLQPDAAKARPADLRALANDPANTALGARPGAALRPPALALALYVGAQVKALSGAPALNMTATDPTGWTFTVARRYASPRQAQAFQYVLDRLQVLNVIAWSRDSSSIHITVSRDAAVLEPLLDRLGGKTP